MNLNIANEDCMELLARTPDKFYDWGIIDPPYGIDAGNMKLGGVSKAKRTTHYKAW